MNKSESKYYNTALLMDEALIALLEKNDFEYITVKEICEKAGVNRTTFYLHYETIADLLNETIEYYNKRFLEMFLTTPDSFIPAISELELKELVLINSNYLRPYLSFIKNNKALYKAAYKNPVCMRVDKQFEDICKHVLFPIMNRFQIPEKEQTYCIKFYIFGCMAIIQEWLKENCADSIEEIEQIMIDCIRPEKGLQGRKYCE